MADELSVVVNSEQVDVLAPPAEVRVNGGVGATGQRGSLFYAGAPAPAAFFVALGISPNLLDLYLQTNTQQMFQFVSTPAGNVWSVLFSMADIMASAIETAVEAQLNNMFEIVSPTNGQKLVYSDSEGKWVNQ